MNKLLTLIVLLNFSFISLFSQTQIWQSSVGGGTTFSSPRAVDLNGDGVLDIVMGGGIDGASYANAITAFNGVNGNVLWTRTAHDEIFVSANFQDISGDGIPDVFIGGRQAQFYAINGSNGNLIWEFYPNPFPVAPGDSGLWNFFSPQFIPDLNGDLIPEILVANGGDHSLPLWETNRPPGHLMILNAATGGILAKAVVPDSAEIYCSPLVLDLKGDGILWVLFGTGGESIGGNFYAVPLSSLVNQNITGATVLASHPTRGFIAPPSVHRSQTHPGYDIVVQGFGGTVYKFNGQTLASMWATTVPGTESSAQPVLGNFTGGDHIPDVFAVLYKGNMTSYTDYYQVMINGANGNIEFIDSLGTLHFPSGNAVDLNNDGRDEAIASITYFENGFFHNKIMSFDFQNETVQQIHQNIAGVNLGSTPLIRDINNNGLLDLVYVVRADSVNPVGNQGYNIFRINLELPMPNAGVAWGSYIGTQYNGVYNYTPQNCGFGSVIQSNVITNISCNGLEDGALAFNLVNPSQEHTYLWSNGEVSSSLNNLGVGIYTVRVTNASGCYEDRTITLNNPYFISQGGITSPTCPGGNNGVANVSSTGCPCMFNTCVFTWDSGVNGAYNSQAVEGWNTIQILHPNGCLVEHSVFVPEANPIIIDSEVNDVSCYGMNDGVISLTGNPLYAVSFLWENNLTSNSISNLSPGIYSVAVSDNRPCTQDLTFTITEPELLTHNAEVDNASCYGTNDGAIAVNASGGNPDYTYVLNGQNYTNNLISSLIVGTYTLSVLDANGCASEVSNHTITQPSAIVLDLSATSESAPGAGDATATVGVSGGNAPYTVTWTDAQNQTVNPALGLTNGLYIVSAVDANGCEFTAELYIQTLNVSDVNSNEQWLIYPNPATDLVYIVGQSNYELAVFDMDGKLVLKGHESPLNVDKLSAGVYVLRIYTTDSVLENRLVILR